MKIRITAFAVLVLAAAAIPTSATALTPTPPPKPECGTMVAFGDGMAGAMHELAHSLYKVSTALIPHADIRFDSEKRGRFGARWSLQFAFGNEVDRTTFERKCGDDLVDIYRAWRLLLEPAITLGKPAGAWDVAFDLRPALRFMNHGEGRALGLGVGFGTTIAFDDPTRASLSPEVILQFGECCSPSFFTVALRYDIFPSGTPDGVFGVSAGWTYW